MPQFGASLTDDRKTFIVQATGRKKRSLKCYKRSNFNNQMS